MLSLVKYIPYNTPKSSFNQDSFLDLSDRNENLKLKCKSRFMCRVEPLLFSMTDEKLDYLFLAELITVRLLLVEHKNERQMTQILLTPSSILIRGNFTIFMGQYIFIFSPKTSPFKHSRVYVCRRPNLKYGDVSEGK